MVFYTYIWLREDGTPYYVGKGMGRRAIRKGSPRDLSRILIQEYLSETDAFFAESFLIAYYGRKDIGTGILRNRTDGGEGTTGAVLSQQTRLKMSKPKSESTRKKIGEAKKGNKYGVGRKMTPENKAKLIQMNRERIRTPEQRRKMSEIGKARPISQKCIEAMRRANIGNKHAVGSKGNLGYKHTEESKKKMRGRKFSEEHRKNLSSAHMGQVPWNKKVTVS